jgi:phosphoenolpyruvate carboxykinase (ATP)
VRTWRDKRAFAATAERLVYMFHDNFQQYAARVDEAVLEAGPDRCALTE